jgi:predicted metal-dependent enzyme (double-stranded beta helix superfamily)
MFDLDCFIAECRAAVSLDPTHKSVREIVARAVSEPTAVIAGQGAPARAEVQKLYNPPKLTILNVIWGPGMTITPYNHLIWEVIGIYTGREDNIFWRRPPGLAPASRPPGRSRWGNGTSRRSGAISSTR